MPCKIGHSYRIFAYLPSFLVFYVQIEMKAMTHSRYLAFVILVVALLILPTGGAQATNAETDGPVIHRVQTGENLRRIAARYGVEVEDLMRWNNLRSSDDVVAGQRLVARVPDQPAGDETSGGVHIVRPGEMLAGIAERYGLPEDAIKQFNDLQSSVVFVGQALRLPPTALLANGLVATADYVVQPEETLADIARRYEISVDDLATLNGLSPASFLRAGQRLIVPSTGETPSQPRADVQKKVIVDISEQRCRRYEGDKLLDTWPCSTGMNNATKTGHFQVQSKLTKAYGGTWDIWMPYWLGIYWSGGTENGFHGIPWNATTGRRIWAGLVGSPATFGCVMLRDNAMKELWNWADIGTEVVIRR